jgi:hypothetical protein
MKQATGKNKEDAFPTENPEFSPFVARVEDEFYGLALTIHSRHSRIPGSEKVERSHPAGSQSFQNTSEIHR